VQEKTRAYLKAARTIGLLTCAKHFPGHGDTAKDSHFVLPVLPYNLDQLRARELRPFHEAIQLGVDCVMTAHLMLPAIDPERIATISRVLLVELLREEMGFGGVTISDALGMDAILAKIKSPEFAKQSIEAQVDLLCLAGPAVTMQDALIIADNLLAALATSPELQKAQEESAARVSKLLTKAAPCQAQPLDATIWAQHQALADRCKSRTPFTETKAYIPEGF
jgi:beta-glucosidase-like glycosyl hydrolase